MSKEKKPRKVRRPNIPMFTEPVAGSLGTGEPRRELSGRETTASHEVANFDYSQVQRDLTRILILAGSIIAVLVGLSFVIN